MLFVASCMSCVVSWLLRAIRLFIVVVLSFGVTCSVCCWLLVVGCW